jgi:hypothetical protein
MSVSMPFFSELAGRIIYADHFIEGEAPVVTKESLAKKTKCCALKATQ